MSLLPSGAIETGGYDINNSLRFRSSASAYLNRTPASAGNRRTWTWSGWVKRGAIANRQGLFDGYSNGTNFTQLIFESDHRLYLYTCVGSPSFIDYSYETVAVFRDPSAWYHIVVAVNTTHATQSERCIFYVNGIRQTLTSAYGQLVQNFDTYINSTSSHSIGRAVDPNAYLDGYMTEINFIDGQALTPSSFGETDAVTGVWKAKKYTGTYGTNGFYLPFTNQATSSYSGSFNGSSQYLSAPDNTVFSWGTGSYTVECWIKTSTKTNYTCIAAKSNPAATDSWYLETDASGYIHYGGNGAITLQGTKDVCDGNWHHIAIVRNGSTNVTLYIDGISNVTASDTNAYDATGYPLTIGYLSSTYPRYFNGQISNLRIVKGTAVYTANFVPSSTALTAISNTSILTLQNSTIIDNSANAFTITNNGTVTTSTVTPFVANIASDNSGNNNNWFTNNINYTTVGTTYDAMTDVPTNTSATVANYCVMNPLAADSNATFSNANLTIASNAAGEGFIPATIDFDIASSTGYYFEVTVDSGTAYCTTGFIPVSKFPGKMWTGGTYPGQSTYNPGFEIRFSDGTILQNGGSSAYGSGATAGDTWGFAIKNGKVWARNSSGWFNSGNPVTEANPAVTGQTGQWLLGYAERAGAFGAGCTYNFGQRPFSYTPPTGYVALNTYNLPDSTIKKGNSYFDAVTYNGSNSNLTVTNAGSFQPDLVWAKSRSGAYNNILVDAIRGGNLYLSSNTTAADTTSTGLATFTSSGITWIGGASGVNASGDTYVDWMWKAGNGTSSNTSGSITSTVSVNTTAGFSVVTYTGTGSSATVGHGLGVAPKMIIVKSRSTAGTDWPVYHSSLGATGVLALDSTMAFTVISTPWNNTAPTSSVFTVGTSGDTNLNTRTYVAYCWAEIAGFSRFTSYTGNGSADGPFIFLGFRPKFVMYKRTDTTGGWVIIDTSRDTYNYAEKELYPHLSNAENTGSARIDILSNGYKIRSDSTYGYINASGGTYIVAAFAENPTKYALAR